MGVSPNWQGMSLAQMHGDINGGAGYQSTSASATVWDGVASQLEEVADRVRTLTQGATSEWQGAGSDAMAASHNQFDTWAQDARELSARATAAADTQSSLFTDTQPKIEAPGDASAHQDNIAERGAAHIPFVTTDQEGFENAESAKQKAAAAAMESYEGSVTSDAGRGYFSTPPVLAVSVGAAPVAPPAVPQDSTPPTPTPNPWYRPRTSTSTGQGDNQGSLAGSTASGSLASNPAAVSSAGWQAPAAAAGPTTASGYSPVGSPTAGTPSAGYGAGTSGATGSVLGGRAPAGVSSQAWSDPTRAGAGSTGGAGSAGFAGAAGSKVGADGDRARGGYGAGTAAGTGAGGSFAGGAGGAGSSGYGAGGGTGIGSRPGYGAGGYGAGGAGYGGGGSGGWGSGGASGPGSPGSGGSAGPGGATGSGGGSGPGGSSGGSSGGGTSTTSSTAAGRGGAAGAAGGRGGKGAEDSEHEVPDYLKTFELFDDGRMVAPPVIGAVDDDR